MFPDPPHTRPGKDNVSVATKVIAATIISVAVLAVIFLVVALSWNDTVKNESDGAFVFEHDRPYVSCLSRRFSQCIAAGASPKECMETHKELCYLRHPETTLFVIEPPPEKCY